MFIYYIMWLKQNIAANQRVSRILTNETNCVKRNYPINPLRMLFLFVDSQKAPENCDPITHFSRPESVMYIYISFHTEQFFWLECHYFYTKIKFVHVV